MFGFQHNFPFLDHRRQIPTKKELIQIVKMSPVLCESSEPKEHIYILSEPDPNKPGSDTPLVCEHCISFGRLGVVRTFLSQLFSSTQS